MRIIGINGSTNKIYENKWGIGENQIHDAGAAILVNGELVAAFEEERLNRIKHTNKWPRLAIEKCLQFAGISVDQVDCFAFGISEEYLAHILPYYFGGQEQVSGDPHRFVQDVLEDQFHTRIATERIELFDHHYSHAVTAFYPSLFNDALVLTIDGSGGSYSGSIYTGHGNELGLLRNIPKDHSLGHFYYDVTAILGFGFFDEYKVMGLAPYGDPATFRGLFDGCYTLLPDGHYVIMNEGLSELRRISPPRIKSAHFDQVQKDLAAGLQEMLETIVFHIVRHFKQVTGHTHLCMAGGVALNCTLNGKLINSGLFEDVFVYPGANDSGLPVGSALAAYFKRSLNPRRVPMKKLYLGLEIGHPDLIDAELGRWKELIGYERVENSSRKAAELLAEGKVIGWVQGRSEFGPRALGNRSILADPRPPLNKDRINSIVKKREGFRPFAPSVLVECANEYFELPGDRSEFSHMTFILKVKDEYREHLGAVTHVDATARVQTVSRNDNQKYWEVIRNFGDITGTPIVLNTSFNNHAEPIVDSISDAIVCFLTTQLDYLVIDQFVVWKKEFPLEGMMTLYPSQPAHMVLRELDSGKLPGTTEKFEIANTYNEKSWAITDDMFGILERSDGRSSLNQIFAETRPGEQKGALLVQIASLWDERLIILSPAPL